MNYWIFQSVPTRYDLREKIKPGKETTWYATRYRRFMSPGDIVYFWMGGPPEIKGIYGWGILTSEPEEKPQWDSYGVEVEYKGFFDKQYIPIDVIEANPTLQDMLILRAPWSTNFRITKNEACVIANLLIPKKLRDPVLKMLACEEEIEEV